MKREIADLLARREKQKAAIEGLDRDAEEHAKLCAAIRAGLGAGPEIADDRLDGAVSYRQNELTKQAATLAARQQQYQEERAKLMADQETIRHAGADGTCPLCRQKLGTHFGSLDQEFSQNCRSWRTRPWRISKRRNGSKPGKPRSRRSCRRSPPSAPLPAG